LQRFSRIRAELESRDATDIESRAQRWQELEDLLSWDGELWQLYPDLSVGDRHSDSQVLQALEECSRDLWYQALNCYISGYYYACIASCAFCLEASLKYKLICISPRYNRRASLLEVIRDCRRESVIPNNDDPVTLAAERVNESRNDIVHANFPRERPDSIIYAEETELHEITGGPMIQSVELFKNLSKDVIDGTKTVLDHISQ
jgi:HEPN domain-containing protein